MTWQLQYLRAREIAAGRERDARLFRVGAGACDDALDDVSLLIGWSMRRTLGGIVIVVGRATSRVGAAMTRIGHALDGADTSPVA